MSPSNLHIDTTTDEQAYNSCRMKFLCTVVAGVLATLGLTTAEAAHYDLNADWGDGTEVNNPNGTWALRYGEDPLPLHYWMPSEYAWIWDWTAQTTVPSFAFETISKWNDCLPGDIIMQGTNGGTNGNICWTAPTAGTVNISGRTWDAYGGRGGSWTLYVDATQVAGGTLAASSKRYSNGVTFAENILAGMSLTDVPVLAGTVVVFNQVAATAGVQMTVSYLPAINRQPQSQVGHLGRAVTFTAEASGNPPLTYQWLKNDAPITGATSASLVLTNLQATDAADYTVVVSNNYGSVTSAAPAILTVAQGDAAEQWSTATLPSGLIAWWRADGDMLDSAGIHDGGGAAPPGYGTGRFGQAFQFNGTDQLVAIPDVHVDLDSWTQFTLEAWVNFDQTADYLGGRAIFSKVGNVNDHVNFNQGYQFCVYDNATKIALAFNSPGQPWPASPTIATLAAPLAINTWHHLVATYDHNVVKIYLNGGLLVSNVIGPVTLQNSSSSLRISKDDNLNVPFAGRIDDARIYNRALSASEVTYIYQGPMTLPVTQGLKLHLAASDVNGGNPADGAAVSRWRDLSGNGLDATPPVFPATTCAAPVYRSNALNGRAGVDFGVSGTDALATALSDQLNFTASTIIMVGNSANSGTHVAVSAPFVMQEFCMYDKGIQHHSSPYHYIYRSHQSAPAGFYIQAGQFGVKPGELVSYIDGVPSTSAYVFGQQSPTLGEVTDYQPVARQAILGWRNSDALGNAPSAGENFGGIICEVLVYDRQLSGPEMDAVNLFLANKYGMPVTPILPLPRLAAPVAGTATLQWDSTLGRGYQLQSNTSLSADDWLNTGSPIIGTGGVLSTDLPIGPEAAKFFRLRLGP
jgi:hypothetical protein